MLVDSGGQNVGPPLFSDHQELQEKELFLCGNCSLGFQVGYSTVVLSKDLCSVGSFADENNKSVPPEASFY